MTVRTRPLIGPGPAPTPMLPCPDCGHRGLTVLPGQPPQCRYCTPRPEHETSSSMTRNRASAKKAGTRFETSIVGYLADQVDDRIERRARNGGKDRGDIGGVRAPGGGRIVLEAKNVTRLNLAGWAAEAEVERGNDDALAGLIVHKRHGNANPADQWVTCTLRELVALLTGERPAGEA